MSTPSGLKPAPAPAALSHERAGFRVDAASLGFRTTHEIEAAPDWVGQERALAALEMGLGVDHAGYNVYVCGLGGTGREKNLASLLEKLTSGSARPGDRVLVQNFQNRDRPRTFYLPAGQGKRLRRELAELVEDVKRLLPETFRKETFEEEKERLAERYGQEGAAIARELQQHAAEKGFLPQMHPQGGVLFLPLKKDGTPYEPQELEELSEAEQADLRQRERELGREVKSLLRKQQALGRRLAREVKDVERRVAADVIAPLIDEISQAFDGNADVKQYLAEVGEHMVENLDLFREAPPQPPGFPFPMMMTGSQDGLLDYEVNVLVDNGGLAGAPVLIEGSPTYKNLFGAVERIVEPSGRLVTAFTRIKAGSLLRAHGGVIVLNTIDVLSEPLVWRALKRCLKSGQLEIETYDPFSIFATTTLKPEPIQISTRVVLTGPTEIFQLLYFYDDDFREIFKVRADFGSEVENGAGQNSFVTQVARIAKEESLPHFEAAAVARLLEYGARLVEDRRKLPSQWDEIGDVMREAALWCRKSQGAAVALEHVEQALDQRRFRLDRVEEKLRELIRDGVLLVDLQGRKVGQINGLAVANLGGYQFGRPSRVTAAVSMGSQGIINIEREANLSGHSHDKGVLILTGYLRGAYAQDFPLSLTASLCFEQSYSGIDGDSASSTELFALLSSLAGVPLRQDLAVTGSVNQWGEIQPIGGVNEKIEGFFATCREVGLSGSQGVLLPARNLDNLVLRPDVVEAIRQGKFHLYPIRHIDEGLEILSGLRAGSVEEEGTIHHAVATRLRRLAEGLRQFGNTPSPPPLASLPAAPAPAPPSLPSPGGKRKRS